MAAAKGGGKEPANIVHQQAILVETIHKEERHQKLFTTYSINPFRKIPTLTGKPNSLHDSLDGEEDTGFKSVIERANEVPTRKFLSPQTEAQEIGWITQPLIKQMVMEAVSGKARLLHVRLLDTLEAIRNDVRFHHPVVQCEMSKYMDVAWAVQQ